MPTPKFLGIPCWVLPIFAGFAWLSTSIILWLLPTLYLQDAVTLLSMITTWVIRGSRHYPEMWTTQHLAYISNVGASFWGKPLFITGFALTTISFSIGFACERWHRHNGRLIYSHSRWMVSLSVLASLLTLAGTCGLFLLTCFDVRRQPFVHYSMFTIAM